MTRIPDAYYLVLDFGKLGRETVINWEKCSQDEILETLLEGDYGGSLLAVHCINRDAGLWSDVSQFMAEQIFERSEFEPHIDLLNFLQAQLGFEVVNQLRPELADA